MTDFIDSSSLENIFQTLDLIMNSVVNLSKRVSEEASSILDNMKDALTVRRSFSQLSEKKATNRLDLQESYDHPSHSADVIRKRLDREVREEKYVYRKQFSSEMKASSVKSSRPSLCSTQPTPDRAPSIDESLAGVPTRLRKKSSREISSKTDDCSSFTNFEACEDFWPSEDPSINPFEVDSLVSTLNSVPRETLVSIIRQLVSMNKNHLETINFALDR